MTVFIGRPASREEMRSDVLRMLYEYWQGLGDGDHLPDRKKLKPMDFKFALPNVFLIEVVDDGRDYYHALAGEGVNAAHGYQVANRHVSEAEFATEEQRKTTKEFYDHLRSVRSPARIIGDMSFVDREHVFFESIYMPLTDENRGYKDSVGAILGGLAILPRLEG